MEESSAQEEIGYTRELAEPVGNHRRTPDNGRTEEEDRHFWQCLARELISNPDRQAARRLYKTLVTERGTGGKTDEVRGEMKEKLDAAIREVSNIAG